MARLVESNEPMMAILEDDVRLSDDFPQVLAAIEAKDGLFDVVDLARGLKRKEFFVPCRHLTNSLQLGRIGYVNTGAFGYVISRSAAQRFLLHTVQFVDEVDRELHRYWVNGLDIYGLTRPVVLHDDAGNSVINESRGQISDYPDADKWNLVVCRNGYRLYNSCLKRLIFPAYVLKGRWRGVRPGS
jgi:glycosyl transferase family 25